MTGDVLLPAARALAYEAGRRIMALLRRPLVATLKADQSPVTNADHEADTILVDGLRRAFPGHEVLSEETGLQGPSGAEFLWMVDPLDGTRAYMKGVPGFSVMLGLLRAGEPHLGIVYDPVDQRLFEAVKGEGAFQWSCARRSPVRVSSRTDWMAMPVIISTGFPDRLKKSLRDRVPVHFLNPINSVGVKTGYLLRQVADLYINHHPVHHWDTLASQVILEEAGGRMTLWDGAALTYDRGADHRHSQPTIASNNTRHGDLAGLVSHLL